jgi:hypothetical protein
LTKAELEGNSKVSYLACGTVPQPERRAAPASASWTLRFDVFKFLLPEVPQSPFFAFVLHYVLGKKRDFAPAARRIDDEVRDSHSAGPASKVFDDVESDFHRSSKVTDPLR